MLISPPFLPAKLANQSDEDWIRTAMLPGEPGDGFFPISYNLGWHGGCHLTAPITSGRSERVRAIADGTVIFRRTPTARSDDMHHPLNYRGGWTDDGCVVLLHQTAIGAGVNAEVTFYSIYMHLSHVPATIRTGDKVSRKDELGQAGQIYGGTTRKIHFEIVSDDETTRRFCGRLTGNLDTSRSGRMDAIYGEQYVVLPVGTPIYGEEPIAHLAVAQNQPPRPSKHARLPPLAPLVAAHTTTQVLVVGIRYGGGTQAQEGDTVTSTCTVDGTLVGTALRETDAGYELYAKATKISKAMPEQNRPAVSALLEIMRFGRIINPNDEIAPLVPVPRWHRINYPGGIGLVDLNRDGTTKFSDADFPQWSGWTLVDDSADHDSRCDSPIIKRWLQPDTGNPTIAQAENALRQAALRRKFDRVVCKFPSEWNAMTILQRWGWLQQPSSSHAEPLTAADFAELRVHISALCFNAPGLSAAEWHWPPLGFFIQFRRCGWLSERELVRCIPATFQTERGARGTARVLSTISDDVALERIRNRDATVLMRICRKYDIDRPQRMAHFLAQIYRETNVLLWAEELASGAAYEGSERLGNIRGGDGIRFKGRGLMQTTGRSNYLTYSKYRGRIGANSFTTEPNNLLLSTDNYICADTAALYWASRLVNGHGQTNINRVADPGLTESDLRSVTRCINGAEDAPQTGLLTRRSHLTVLSAVLLDQLMNITPAIERKNV